MRFASLGASNAANYAAAGKSVADSSARVFAIQRKTGPDYGMLSQTAMNTQSAEKIASMKAAAHVTKAGIKNLELGTKLHNEAAVFNDKLDRANSRRKAGSLAAIGKIGGAAFLAAQDNTKGRKYPTADYQSLLDKNNAARDAIKARQGEEIDALGPTPTSNSVSSSTSTTGNSAGKAVGGGSSTASPLTGAASSGNDPLAGLTSKDFDDMAYTISSEAALGTDDVYGVAANLVTRLRSGKYGNSIHAISHAPGQYEGVYKGRSVASPQISQQLQSTEGRTKIIEAFNRLDGRTEFKGQTMLRNRVASEDPMFDPKGNFYHYAGQ